MIVGGVMSIYNSVPDIMSILYGFEVILWMTLSNMMRSCCANQFY